mmetsp:Transcript_33300/g.40950  ORF Transcript_33300/g.40950 Transcript_33300/m.40950 type:complete len:92 (+) Transcript_33300:60-335(+)
MVQCLQQFGGLQFGQTRVAETGDGISSFACSPDVFAVLLCAPASVAQQRTTIRNSGQPGHRIRKSLVLGKHQRQGGDHTAMDPAFDSASHE